MKIHIIMHESFEGPAAIEQWARQHSFSLSYTRLYLSESYPETVDQFDFLVIMGGPQSSETTLDECPYFDAKKEIAFIKQAMAADKKILGICLGAQMIGEAFGAAVERSPCREIGIFPIHLNEQASHDPIFKDLPKTMPVMHWHGDMPGISEGAVNLAYSEGCPRQIVRYTEQVYGFQCHFEFTHEAVKGMLENCSQDLEVNNNQPYIQNADALLAYDFNEMNQWLFIFLDRFIVCSSH